MRKFFVADVLALTGYAPIAERAREVAAASAAAPRVTLPTRKPPSAVILRNGYLQFCFLS